MHVPNRFRVVADDIGMQPEDGRLRKDVTKTSHFDPESLLLSQQHFSGKKKQTYGSYQDCRGSQSGTCMRGVWRSGGGSAGGGRGQIKYINTWFANCNVRVTCRVLESCEISFQ